MTPTGLKRHYGGPAVEASYWPRPDITDPMVETLLVGESIKLLGLRRTGKSSVLLEVEAALRRAGRKPVYVDVQGFDRVDHLISALVQALPASDGLSKISSLLSHSRVRKSAGAIREFFRPGTQEPPSPRAVLHQVELLKGDFNTLLAQQKGAVVLLVDELPYLVDNMLKNGFKPAEVNGFLATMRSWRQQGHLPMLLTGSMSLTWLVREAGIAREHFNDLVPYDAPPPLAGPEARAMLAALALGSGCTWTDEAAIAAIIEETAALYPSFLQFAFGRLSDHGAHTIEDIRRIFAERIRPSLDEDFYAQFDTRLARYGEEDRKLARSVLRCIAKSDPQPVSRLDLAKSLPVANDIDELLSELREDGFVSGDTKAGTFGFTSPLVKTWWNSKPYRT